MLAPELADGTRSVASIFGLRAASNVDGVEWIIDPLEDFHIMSIERLVVEDADVYAESGIVLEDAVGREIIVTAGTAPGSVVKALPSSPISVGSEFEIGQLQRRPM